MISINTSEWKEFKIGDLFERQPLVIKKSNFNKAVDISNTPSDEFNLPLVNAKHGNNGIMYWGREKDFESAEMTIDIVQDGAASTGDVYPQPQKTGVLYNAYLIKPKIDVDSKEILMFLAPVIQQTIKHRFGYDNKCTWDKVKELTIKLPAKSDVEPDWEYMEKYIKNIEIKVVDKISKLKSIFNNENRSIDISKWEDYKLSDLGFACYHGKRLNKNERIEGDTCFITAGKENQGIVGCVGNKIDTYKESITVDMFGNCFYHKELCGGDDNVYFFVNEKLSESIKIFISACINSILKDKYSYAHQFRQNDADLLTVKLPAKSKNEPDWEYMETHVVKLMKKAENKVDKFKDIIEE